MAFLTYLDVTAENLKQELEQLKLLSEQVTISLHTIPEIGHILYLLKLTILHAMKPVIQAGIIQQDPELNQQIIAAFGKILDGRKFAETARLLQTGVQ